MFLVNIQQKVKAVETEDDNDAHFVTLSALPAAQSTQDAEVGFILDGFRFSVWLLSFLSLL